MDRYQAMATFVRVVETGSFSAAARQLNVGQPAVSKTVAQLEGRLQVSLLTRSTHRLTACLKNGGTLERAATMANHASTRTTQLYDRRADDVTLDEVERVRI